MQPGPYTLKSELRKVLHPLLRKCCFDKKVAFSTEARSRVWGPRTLVLSFPAAYGTLRARQDRYQVRPNAIALSPWPTRGPARVLKYSFRLLSWTVIWPLLRSEIRQHNPHVIINISHKPQTSTSAAGQGISHNLKAVFHDTDPLTQ